MKYQSLIGEYVLCVDTKVYGNINVITKGKKYLIIDIDDWDVLFSDDVGDKIWRPVHYFDVDNHIRTQRIKELLDK